MRLFASLLLVFFSAGLLTAQCPTRIEFNAQAQIDNFPFMYPNCTEIPGEVLIRSHEEFPSDIKNLQGLSRLKSIGGNLIIHANTGLESLEGLENLNTLGGDLQISYNLELTDISALGQLGSLPGELIIINNPMLSDCSLEIICAKVSNPDGMLTIEHNNEGCNSIPEIQAGCAVSFSEPAVNTLHVFPNPVSDVLYLQAGSALHAELFLFDATGKLHKSLQMNTDATSLDLSDLPGGMYLLQIYQDGEVRSLKVVKE
jgi:hypothetical protein